MSEVAPALLGSTLLAAAETHEKLRPAPASSGSAVIDDMALEGGFRYGEITAIAGATGTGKTLVCDSSERVPYLSRYPYRGLQFSKHSSSC